LVECAGDEVLKLKIAAVCSGILYALSALPAFSADSPDWRAGRNFRGQTCISGGAWPFSPEYIAALEGRLPDKVTGELRTLMTDRKLKRIWIRVYFRRTFRQIAGRTYEDTHEDAVAKLKSLGMKIAWTPEHLVTGTCPRSKIDEVAALDSVIWVVPEKPLVHELTARRGKVAF
jgi:hypothetical protein